MACYKPLTAYYSKESGQLTFSPRGDCAAISLPCGRCIGCRIDRSRDWQTRLINESQTVGPGEALSLTLTYAPEHLPEHGSLRKRDLQLFMKRLRAHVWKKNRKRVRFFAVGEYGTRGGRSHYHALTFGFPLPDDAQKFRKSGKGNAMYRSDTLEKLWGMGDVSIQLFCSSAARYVTSYVTKRLTGELARPHLEVVGELGQLVAVREPEFQVQSSRPGIGGTFFQRFSKDIASSDFMILRTRTGFRKAGVPKYYDRLLKRADPALADEIKAQRQLQGVARRWDQTPERLAVREEVAKADVARRRADVF